MKTLVLAAAALYLSGAANLVLAADDPKDHDNHASDGARVPSGGQGPQGGTGSKPMSEGTQVGAPGNIVTATQSTMMRSHDQDGDGMINLEEAAKDPGLKKAFGKLDANQDSRLDETEFARYEVKESAVTGAAPVKPVDPKAK